MRRHPGVKRISNRSCGTGRSAAGPNSACRAWREHAPWTTWLMLGGRGAGKTRTGAEWVRGIALGEPDFAHSASRRIALIGETFADARNVMVEGPAGLLAIHARHERPVW